MIKNDIKSILMLVQHEIYSFQDIATEGSHNIIPFILQQHLFIIYSRR